MEGVQSLNQLSPGVMAFVTGLSCSGAMRRRLLDLGLVEGTAVECVGQSPRRDPKAFLVRGAVIAIRSEDSRHILVSMKKCEMRKEVLRFQNTEPKNF